MSYLELAKSVRAEREKALLPTPEATPQGLAADMERRKFGSGVAPVGPQSGNTIPCPHRPPGEAEERLARAGRAADLFACACCGGPVRPDLWVDGLRPVCRNGRPVKEGSGHLTRAALHMGARRVEGDRDDR